MKQKAFLILWVALLLGAIAGPASMASRPASDPDLSVGELETAEIKCWCRR